MPFARDGTKLLIMGVRFKVAIKAALDDAGIKFYESFYKRPMCL